MLEYLLWVTLDLETAAAFNLLGKFLAIRADVTKGLTQCLQELAPKHTVTGPIIKTSQEPDILCDVI